MKIKEFLIGTKEFLMDTTIEAIERHYDEEIVQAKERQRKKDIYAAICAFVKLKQSDGTIYELLNDCFGIQDISEAREYVKKARVHMQVVRLRDYCIEIGMTPSEFRQYAIDHKLEETISNNLILLDMSANKLKATIDKK